MCVDIQDAFTTHACVRGRVVHCCTVMADGMHMLKVCFGASGLACLCGCVCLFVACRCPCRSDASAGMWMPSAVNVVRVRSSL